MLHWVFFWRDPLARQSHNITLWSLKLPQELLSPNQTWTAKHLQNSGERGHRVLSILLLASLKRTTWRESHMNRPHFEDQIFKVRQKTRQQLNSPQVNLSLKRMTPRCPSGKTIGINGCIQHIYIYNYIHKVMQCYIHCIYIAWKYNEQRPIFLSLFQLPHWFDLHIHFNHVKSIWKSASSHARSGRVRIPGEKVSKKFQMGCLYAWGIHPQQVSCVGTWFPNH